MGGQSGGAYHEHLLTSNPFADDNQSSSKPADETPTQPKKVSKAERRRQQYEFNKKLWEEAEAPENPYFVQKSNDVPLQSGFAPQMKLLSRRPAPRIARKDPITGLEQLSVEDDNDDEEDERKAGQMTMEERIEKAKKEREEKQRKYDEVRQRLFGSAATESGASSPSSNGRGSGGSSSPQRQHQASSERGGGSSGRGRGRGNAGSAKATPGRQLFDPNSSPRAGSASSSGTNTPMEGMPMRAPRGPDGSGRGGRGFVNRGGQGTAAS